MIILSFGALQLKFDSSLDSILPKKSGKGLGSDFFQSQSAFERIIINISHKDSNTQDAETLIAYASALSEQLRDTDKESLIDSIELIQDESRIINIVHSIQNNLPFLLNKEDYTWLDSAFTSSEYRTKRLESNYKLLISPNGMAAKNILSEDPLGLSFRILQRFQQIQLDSNNELYDGFILDIKQNTLTFFLKPRYKASETSKNKNLDRQIQTAIAQTNKELGESKIDCHYFGSPLVAAGNASIMQKDTLLTLSITIVLLLILFLSYFKSIRAPFQILIPVVFGALFGMCMMYFFKGSVHIMSLGASSIILAIAVNYSLHFLTHVKHHGSVKEAVIALAHPLSIGSFTTIAAFMGLTLVNTPILQELGLFAAFNLIGASICTLLFLPHFVSNAVPVSKDSWIDRLAHHSIFTKKWLIALILVVTIALSFFISKVSFTDDMMKMNYMSESLRKNQEIINRRNAASLNTVFAINEGNSREQALEKAMECAQILDSLKNQRLVSKYLPISYFLMSKKDAQQRLNNWNSYWQKHDRTSFVKNIEEEGNKIGYSSIAFKAFGKRLNQNYLEPDSLYRHTLNELLGQWIINNGQTSKVLIPIKCPETMRSKLWDAFPENDNTYLSDKQAMASSLVTLMKEDFNKILFFTSFIVFFTILISYGRIELALISFIPMLITWLCILGLMGLFGIQFNIVNIIISTLIFGLGDDFSIFTTDNLISNYKYGIKSDSTSRNSIFLSAITTIIGLGILLIAKHPSMRSIALVSVIGIISILFVSQTLQPFLFNAFIQYRSNKGQQPFTFWTFIKSVYAFIYYVLGCLVASIIGFILVKCIPFAKDKLKYAYHVVLCKFMWSLLYMMANVKKTITNKHLFTPEKPAVLIANHSSFLDLLRVISLHPKIILLTNKWVWNSPIFGAIVRMADYYPVGDGADNSIEKLKYWVDRGYSIAVFPEGTRSYTDDMKRFHKGAFFIAESLGLDVQPILFHGIGNTMRKGDFMLKDTEINIKFLPRIPLSDFSFGIGFADRCKTISRYFKKEFGEYAKEKETVHYFRNRLIHNYLFKGPVLEWYCKIKTRLEKDYQLLESMVPQKGSILDIGCGYGFLAYMLHYTSKDRTITGIDYDAEKITVASNNFDKNASLEFICSDVSSLSKETFYDGILILDVLHYLTPSEQTILLENCVSILQKGGNLIIRDGFEDLKKKHKGTVWTEIFSTKLLKFNKTKNPLHFLKLKDIERLATMHHLSMKILDETKLTSNLVIELKKQ